MNDENVAARPPVHPDRRGEPLPMQLTGDPEVDAVLAPHRSREAFRLSLSDAELRRAFPPKPTAQRVLATLIQIAYCGVVVGFSKRDLARLSGLSLGQVEANLGGLAHNRHILIDDDLVNGRLVYRLPELP